MTIYYGSSVLNGTLTTASTMSTTTGGTETSKLTSVSGGNHFAEIWSQGGSETSQTSIGSPSGKGWVSSAPGAGTFATGNWSASVTVSYGATDAGNTLTIRFYKYSSGTYTSIGTIVATSNTTSKTTISFAATSMSSVTFAAGDLLYVDLWLTDTSGTGGDNPTIYESNSATAGVASDVQVTTSTFTLAGTAVNKDVTVRGRISALGYHDITTRAKISAAAHKDITVRGNVGSAAKKDITVRGRISGFIRKDITTRGKVSAKANKDITVRGNIIARNYSGGFSLWSNGTGTTSFDTFRVTQYPDPSILLTPATRAANSLVNWTANTPANTSLAVATSVDNGVTWSSVAAAGNTVPNITLSPDPTYDTFSVNSSANYTSSNGTGGSTATWTWDVANSRISVAGGSRAVLLYTGLTVTDVDMFVDIKQAQNGGMVWRYQDASNYYELVVKDSTNGNSYTINKMASGTLSQLATASIVFTTGTHHYARVTMLSGVITAYLDGTQILTYTDGSPIASGSAGLRNDTGTSLIYQLRIQPQGQDVTGMYLCERWTLTSTDPTVTPQVLDTQAFVSNASVGIGTLIPKADYTDTYVSANIDDLKKQSNYWWYVSSNKDNFGNYPVSFADRTATPAPWPLDSANSTYTTVDGQKIGDVLVANLSVANSADLYRNRQKIKNAIATSTFEQSFTGNNQTRTWNVSHPFALAPTGMTLNGQSVAIGVQGVDTGKDFYYQIGSTAITQDNSGTLLQSTDTLDVPYTGSYLQDVIVNNANPGDFPGTICQTALAAIDKSSGIVTNVVDVSGQNMTVDAATTLANQLLSRYGVIGETLNFTTFRSGLAPGMQLTVYIPEMNINDVQMLVVSVDTTPQTSAAATGGILWLYTIVAQTGPSLGSWTKLLASGLTG